ncbi:RNA polymerase, sigma subunit, ECF family [Poseidonocella pacifica]|uniref:RNA polymerase, sigma subunit, ECF family n=2 Tax=Poseidonocella pacifica TaxID=871651 RepID=A0A1I0Y6S7_9RHOB|nr:RNA polymerase, sigma subunit, ECF family [Poseidonocella pacifica]
MPFDAQSDATDDALLARFARGDRVAAQSLTLRLTPRAFAQAKRMLNDVTEAEDVAQEAMLRLWRIAPDWRPGEAKVTTWLYRVVANLCTDRLRRRRGVGLDAIAEPEDPAPGAERLLQDRDRASALETALQALPERQREAVVLRHLDGCANPEIAEIMGVGVEAVESLIARGKRKLSELLGGAKDELGYEET